MIVGERRLNMLRAFNAREGFTRGDDRLPEKFFQPLAGTGPTSGIALDKDHFEHEKDVYYKLAGWDNESGNPTRSKLVELGLEWLAV
jgi:aldehyde:ferredoxin oxidoreductase